MKNVSVIIPAYNEEAAIEGVVNEIKRILTKKKYKYEIIVVDDCSTDRTPELISRLKIRVITNQVNKGVGAARNTGLRAAKYENIVMIDGDGTYPVDVIPELLNQLAEFDMTVGARRTEMGTLMILRKFSKFLIRKLASFVSGYKIPDLNSGLRTFKKNIALKFLNILPNSHSWVSTITLCFLCNDYNVKYIPIEYYKRKGKSSFHPIRDTFNYLTLVFRVIMYFSPLKIFVPIAMIMMSWGLWRAVYHARLSGRSRVLESDIIILIFGCLIGILGLLADLIVKFQKLQYIKR